MKVKYCFVILTALVCSCGGVSDFSLDLGSDYHFLSNGSNSKYIYYGRGNRIEEILVLPAVRDIDYDGFHIICSQRPSKEGVRIIVEGNLSGKHSHNTMLLNKRKLDKSIFKGKEFTFRDSLLVDQMKKKGYVGDYMTKDREILREIADSIMSNESNYKKLFLNEINYWIVDKRMKLVYGPFNKNQFRSKIKELNVSEDLKLSLVPE